MIFAATALGWLKRRLWGWRMAVAIIATQVLGDLANLVLGRIVEGGIGAIVAGGLLAYLLQNPVRSVFEHRGSR
jgi:hypothetical protein